ncbi:MAG: hypothetical protein A4E60_00968 [Syntrophorhabdus sp. PtaB.Bin047]|jgi:hypothetical protein|nr:MAG: hypothetical protein A4E60_00968 [Syntrophorhabdus sp. PtaB.Bin047]
MSNRNKKLHTVLSGQGNLFDTEISEGALDLSLIFRDSLTKALSACKDSRYQVAAKISELTRRNLSKDMLDKYTSANLDYGFRAEELTAFCAVTRSLEPFRALLTPLSCDVVDPEDSKHLRLARLLQQQMTLTTEIARIESELGIKRKL